MSGKDFFSSKATWGAVLLLLTPVLQYFGIVVDVDPLVEALATLGGFVVFTWGQLTRKEPIVSVAGVPVKKEKNENVE